MFIMLSISYTYLYYIIYIYIYIYINIFTSILLDDDRRALTSDVTAYVNKNQYRVVQFPFKACIARVDDVKRVIGGKPV